MNIKFEQGYKHKEYVEHLVKLFYDWTWYETPSEYCTKKGPRAGLPHSYFFYTFKHKAWSPLWDVFMVSGKKKSYVKGTIEKY